MILTGVVAIAAAVAVAQTITSGGTFTPTGWVVPVTPRVTTVQQIRLDTVIINCLEDTTTATIKYSFLDAAGTTLQTCSTNYPQVQLEYMLRSRGSSVTAMRMLFLSMAHQEAIR